MTDKAQIFLKDINETGFYCAVDDTERLYIYEVINNVSQEWIKKDPKAKLLDQWIYDYTDYDDRKVYGTSGNLECGQFLVEDKPIYKEQLARKTTECEKYEQALEEVYGIIVRLLIMKDVKHLSKEINDILDIISKAKESNNE